MDNPRQRKGVWILDDDDPRLKDIVWVLLGTPEFRSISNACTQLKKRVLTDVLNLITERLRPRDEHCRLMQFRASHCLLMNSEILNRNIASLRISFQPLFRDMGVSFQPFPEEPPLAQSKPWPRGWAVLRFLMSKKAREEVFEPSYQDFLEDYLLACRENPSTWGRRRVHLVFTWRVLVLAGQCLQAVLGDRMLALLQSVVPHIIVSFWKR
jgi:hypothetical protein